MAKHALEKRKPYKKKSSSEEAKAKEIAKAEAKANILKTGTWRDLYDDKGDPLFETSDESSEDDE